MPSVCSMLLRCGLWLLVPRDRVGAPANVEHGETSAPPFPTTVYREPAPLSLTPAQPGSPGRPVLQRDTVGMKGWGGEGASEVQVGI